MKKIIFAIFSFVLLVSFSISIASYSYLNAKTMKAEDVKLKWGDKKADYKKFKSASYDEKSKMAYSIMTDKLLIGKSYEEIREIFGENDGYFFNDTIPTYIIKDGKNKSDDTWQLVFRMSRVHKVKEIFMHKNCCDK